MAYTVKQIQDLVNKVVLDAYGDQAITANNLTGLISMGDKVFSSANDKELFMSALTNMIGKTVFSNRSYSAKTNNVVMEDLEYGTMIRKIYVEPMEATENSSWKLTSGTPMDLGSITPPEAKQKLFESRNTWEIEITIPDYQIKSAFRDYGEMSAFISSIYTQIENSLNIQIERLSSTCLANFIGEKIFYAVSNPTKGIHAVDLLSNYNIMQKDPGNIIQSPEDALRNTEFLKYAGREIKQIIKRMENMGVMFNTEGYKRFTPADSLHVLLHTEYASANSTYLQSSTFHNEMTALPNYDEVSFWQSQGERGGIEDTTAVNITTSNGHVVEKRYIIGFIFDHDALGIMVNRRSSTAFYNPKYELTNKWEKVDYGFFNDLSENGVVFYLGDSSTP